MKICYIVVSAFLIIFYPRQLTHLMCFGRHRDKNIVKSKAAYWGIYLFWTIIFLIGCLMMGSAMKVNSTMDKLVYYFILGSDNRDCVELGSEENDEAYISTYYTRKEINESFLFEVAYGHFPRPSGPRSPARQGHIKRPVLRLAEPSFLRPANQCC